MIKWLVRSRIAAFERAYGYDAAYMRELLEIDTGAFLRFARVAGMAAYSRDISADAWFAAKLVGALAEACGPCTQLVIRMAEEDGVPVRQLRAILADDEPAMSDEVRLAVGFARAALAHSRDAEAYRRDVVARWGPRGLVSLAFALTSARLFPTLKYALGHGADCRRLLVAGAPVAVAAHPLRSQVGMSGMSDDDGKPAPPAARARTDAVGAAAAARVFEPHRRHLTGLAYRMLGSLAEAEDVVQDAFLRWAEGDRSAVTEPRRYLAKVVTRLCLDHLKSATARRELYVGSWLPEPIVDEAALAPDAATAYADDLSVALLLALERLSPLERASFLLHDVFDMSFAAVAEALERSEAACRQLAARAREHVQQARPRASATNDDAGTRAMLTAVRSALTTGDIGSLARLLAEDAVFYADGGGKRVAALNPIYGRDRIMRFFIGAAAKEGLPPPQSLSEARINGLPGFVIRGPTSPDGVRDVQTFAFEIVGGQVSTIYVVRNPDKLHHLA